MDFAGDDDGGGSGDSWSCLKSCDDIALFGSPSTTLNVSQARCLSYTAQPISVEALKGNDPYSNLPLIHSSLHWSDTQGRIKAQAN